MKFVDNDGDDDGDRWFHIFCQPWQKVYVMVFESVFTILTYFYLKEICTLLQHCGFTFTMNCNVHPSGSQLIKIKT